MDMFFASLPRSASISLSPEKEYIPKESANLESSQVIQNYQVLEKSQPFTERSFNKTEDDLYTKQSQNSQLSSQLSITSNSNESIVISDEEVNYSIRNHRKENESDEENIFSQDSDVEMEEDVFKNQEDSEIIDLCDESLVEILDKEVSSLQK